MKPESLTKENNRTRDAIQRQRVRVWHASTWRLVVAFHGTAAGLSARTPNRFPGPDLYESIYRNPLLWRGQRGLTAQLYYSAFLRIHSWNCTEKLLKILSGIVGKEEGLVGRNTAARQSQAFEPLNSFFNRRMGGKKRRQPAAAEPADEKHVCDFRELILI